MSAVERYEAMKQDRLGSEGPILASVIADYADAAIAELEAKLERASRRKANTEWNAMVSQSDENLARAEQAEAAMVTLIDDYNRDFAKPLIDDERKRAERAEAESARLRALWAKADAEEWERMR